MISLIEPSPADDTNSEITRAQDAGKTTDEARQVTQKRPGSPPSQENSSKKARTTTTTPGMNGNTRPLALIPKRLFDFANGTPTSHRKQTRPEDEGARPIDSVPALDQEMAEARSGQQREAHHGHDIAARLYNSTKALLAAPCSSNLSNDEAEPLQVALSRSSKAVENYKKAMADHVEVVTLVMKVFLNGEVETVAQREDISKLRAKVIELEASGASVEKQASLDRATLLMERGCRRNLQVKLAGLTNEYVTLFDAGYNASEESATTEASLEFVNLLTNSQDRRNAHVEDEDYKAGVEWENSIFYLSEENKSLSESANGA
jgi:hypothetical protein